MEIIEILNKHGKENRKQVLQILNNFGNKLFIKDNWNFVDSYDSETIMAVLCYIHTAHIGAINLECRSYLLNFLSHKFNISFAIFLWCSSMD